MCWGVLPQATLELWISSPTFRCSTILMVSPTLTPLLDLPSGCPPQCTTWRCCYSCLMIRRTAWEIWCLSSKQTPPPPNSCPAGGWMLLINPNFFIHLRCTLCLFALPCFFASFCFSGFLLFRFLFVCLLFFQYIGVNTHPIGTFSFMFIKQLISLAGFLPFFLFKIVLTF